MSTDKKRETKEYVPQKMRLLTRFELMIYLAAGFFFFMSAYMTIASYDYLVDYYAGYDTTLEGKWGVCLQYIAKQCGNWYGFTVLFFIAAGFAKRLEALAPCSAEMGATKKATAKKDWRRDKEQTVLAESKSAEDKAVAKEVDAEGAAEQVAPKESEPAKMAEKEKATERKSEKGGKTEEESEKEKAIEKESEKEGKIEEESEKKKVTEKESKKKKAAKKKTDENTGAEKESKAEKVTGKETGAKNGSKKKGKEKKATK